MTAGTEAVRSYTLDGDLLWELRGMSGLTTPTPFTAHDLVYISSGYPGGGIRPVYAIRPGASGDISIFTEEQARNGIASGFPGPLTASDDIAWSYPLLGTYNTTAIVYGDIFYTLLDRGFLVAHDARTGEEIYGRRRLEIGNGFTASPGAYNGKVFLLSEDGETYVVRAGREFEILHTNMLNEMTLSDARHRARQSLPPDAVEALPHREMAAPRPRGSSMPAMQRRGALAGGGSGVAAWRRMGRAGRSGAAGDTRGGGGDPGTRQRGPGT